jgi:hypothetical protein
MHCIEHERALLRRHHSAPVRSREVEHEVESRLAVRRGRRHREQEIGVEDPVPRIARLAGEVELRGENTLRRRGSSGRAVEGSCSFMVMFLLQDAWWAAAIRRSRGSHPASTG